MSGFGWESSGGGGGSLPSGFLQVAGGVPLDSTLRTITDGLGTASPLQLSTTSVSFGGSTGLNWDNTNKRLGIGTTSPSARLHVKGDGSNPIALFETTASGSTLRIDNSQLRFGGSVPFGSLAYAMSGTTFSGTNNGTSLGFYSQNSLPGTTDRFDFGFGGDAVSNTAGTVSHLALVRTFAAAAGTASFRPLNIAYTINNSGAQTGGATATGIFLNATETALNGMAHNLMDLQRGGVSQFSVSRVGLVSSSSGFESVSGSNRFANLVINGGTILQTTNGGGSAAIELTTTGTRLIYNSNLQFGGGTNGFPMIKKNASSAAIDFRLADDSGFCNVSAAALTLSANLVLSSGNAIYAGTQLRIGAGAISILSDSGAGINFTAGTSGRSFGVSNATSGAPSSTAFLFVGDTATGVTMGVNANANANAVLDLVSTTKGLLFPRMTTSEKNAITSPSGLVVYDTTLGKLCVRGAANWETITSV